MKKKLLFVVGSLTMGGIETYITRLSYLLKDKYILYVLNLSSKIDPGLINQLSTNAIIINFKEISTLEQLSRCNLSAINHALSINFQSLNKIISNLDIIHSVDSETNMIGKALGDYYKAKFITSSYHPLEYVWDNKFYFRKIQKELIQNLNKNNIFYMNDAVKDATLNSLMINDKTDNIIPLGINIDKYEQCEPNFSSNKIVSIGRLTHFKTYNELMIKKIDEINRKYNRNFEYHIYGDGILKSQLIDLAKKQKSKIIFHGKVDYKELPNIFRETFIFIGIGTTIIESSAAGIPSILGVGDYKKELVYGYFSQYDNYLVGEECSECELISLPNLFENICNMSKEEYTILSNAHRKKAEKFDIKKIINILIAFFENSSTNSIVVKYSKIRYFLSNISWLILNKLNILNDREFRYHSLENK